MTTIHTWNLTAPDLEEYLTGAMEITVKALMNDGLLEEERGLGWVKTHVILFRRTSAFASLIRSLLGKEDTCTMMVATIKDPTTCGKVSPD